MVVKTVEEYQVIAASIASKIQRDPEFASRIRHDPLGTLRKFDMGNDALRELINEDQGLKQLIQEPGSEGIFIPLPPGCEASCLCTSGCCITCWASTRIESLTSEFGAPDPQIPVNPAREKLLRNLIKSGHITSPEEQ